jgi:HEAT repeat protein
MNINVKRGILAFAICLVLGTIAPVTIGSPGEDPNSIREKLHQAVENAKKDVRKESELLEIIDALGTDEGLPVSKELLPDFVSFLKEKDPRLQVLGTKGLYLLKSPDSKEALTEYLKGKDFAKLEKRVYSGEVDERQAEWEVRASSSAILSIGEIGDKSAIPLLESFRWFKELQFEWGGGPVERALAKLGPEGIRSLSNLGPKADYSQILKATEALRRVHDSNMAPALIETVKDANCVWNIRAAALGSLSQMKGVDTLPSILEAMKESKYPKLLREAAAEEAGRTHRTEAEQALLEVLDDPNCDIRIACLYGLALLNPEKHVPRILKIVLDESAPFAEREELSDKMANAMEPKELKPHAEMLRMGIKAVKKGGSPADIIRVYMWKALHRATGEEPPLELMDGRLAYDELCYDFETKFTRENVHASAEEIDQMVNEKIKSIIVKWQPPKEGEKP